MSMPRSVSSTTSITERLNMDASVDELDKDFSSVDYDFTYLDDEEAGEKMNVLATKILLSFQQIRREHAKLRSFAALHLQAQCNNADAESFSESLQQHQANIELEILRVASFIAQLKEQRAKIKCKFDYSQATIVINNLERKWASYQKEYSLVEPELAEDTDLHASESKHEDITFVVEAVAKVPPEKFSQLSISVALKRTDGLLRQIQYATDQLNDVAIKETMQVCVDQFNQQLVALKAGLELIVGVERTNNRDVNIQQIMDLLINLDRCANEVLHGLAEDSQSAISLIDKVKDSIRKRQSSMDFSQTACGSQSANFSRRSDILTTVKNTPVSTSDLLMIHKVEHEEDQISYRFK
ncbi:MAG: hypothetical protein P4M14_04190 [Gammaproteobacteria bacterium]|nr:hypothetical protein [Gammaproteobacteria bacterium]